MAYQKFNVTDSSGQCPIGFRIETATNVSFCIRDTSSAGCGSVLFETRGITYTQVCGYARGYSYNSPDSFATPAGMVSNEPLGASYVDGISITYGTPPTHIWSFAAGVTSQEAQVMSVHVTFNQELVLPCTWAMTITVSLEH